MKQQSFRRVLSIALLCMLLVCIMTDPVFAVTPVTGIEATKTGNCSVKVSGTSAVGSIGSYSDTSGTIVVTYSGEETAKVSFTYRFETSGRGKATASLGSTSLAANTDYSYSATMNKNDSVTFSLAAGNFSYGTLTLSGFNISVVQEGASATVYYDSSKGSVQLGGSSVGNGESATVSDGMISAVATVSNDSYLFLGWVDRGTHEILSTKSTDTLGISQDTEIDAIFVTKTNDTAWFIVDNKYMTNDLNYASSTLGTKIVLTNNGTLAADDYTIQSGDTLLIPFDPEHTVIAGNANYNAGSLLSPSYPYVVHAYNADLIARSQYRVLTMASGANITVANTATLSVESKLANQFIGQVGSYGAIVMHNNSTITVQSGGTLAANGYIFPVYDENSKVAERGTVTVESGGTVYEPMSIMDYPGSGSLVNTILTAKTFPMRSYAARNVEVPMTLNSGAKEYVFACLYGDTVTVGTNPLYVLMIADGEVDGETPLFQNFGTITKSYENGRMTMTIAGNLTMNSLTVEVNKSGITTEISTSDTTGCYIPSCYDLTVSSGTVTLNDNLIVCEGSTITISKDATVQTAKNLYVLDADNDPGAVGNVTGLGATGIGGGWNGCSIDVQDVHGKYYTYVPTDAVVDVNGTLSAGATFYTSVAGACITSSEGVGTVVITAAPTNTTINVKKTNDHTSVDVTAAKLKNSDDTYVETADVGAGTYTYKDGFWHKPRCDGTVTTNKTEPTCTEDGVETTGCVCGIISSSEHLPKTGHKYEAVFTWAEDYSTCTVVLICANNNEHTHSSDATVTSETTATCTQAGMTTYTAKYTLTEAEKETLFTETKNVEVPALGHTWDENGVCTVCGVFKIYASSLRAGDSLRMYFYVQASHLSDLDTNTDTCNYRAEIVRYYADGTSVTKVILASEWEKFSDSLYRFSYDGIAAKEMTDEMVVTIQKKNGEVWNNVSNSTTESVEGYAIRYLNSFGEVAENSKNYELRRTLVDLLEYGAASQAEFAYNTGDLANAQLGNHESYATAEGAVTPEKIENTGATYFQGANLTLKSNLIFTFYFSANAEGMSANISYTDHYGTTHTKTAELTQTTETGTTYYVVSVEGLAIADGRQEITCELVNGETVQETVKSSVQSYLYEAINSSTSAETLKTVCRKLMNFIDSAYSYFHFSETSDA